MSRILGSTLEKLVLVKKFIDAMWRHSPESTLALVMTCCLAAPSHYLDQCWLIINEAYWHLAETNFAEIVLDITHYKIFQNYIFENTATSPRRQWVNNCTDSGTCTICISQFYPGICATDLCLNWSIAIYKPRNTWSRSCVPDKSNHCRQWGLVAHT